MIEGKNIILRTIREEDIDEIFSLTSNVSEIGQFWPSSLLSKQEFNKKFHTNGFWSNDSGSMIILNKEGKRVGQMNFFKGLWYQDGYEVGYQIYRNEDRGKGYVTEALPIFSAYLFETKPIQRLQINAADKNIPSRIVAEKCGYKHDGIMRKAVFIRGRYHDLNLFSLLREECPSLSSVLK